MYLEAYTSILGVPRARLEEAWSIKIEEAPRELVESEIEPILDRARHEDIAMLVVGDPFGATTHCDLLARARELGVTTHVVHNASIMNAIGCCGLQLYRFGETISIPFFSQTWRPDSFYAKVAANRRAGLHTLAAATWQRLASAPMASWQPCLKAAECLHRANQSDQAMDWLSRARERGAPASATRTLDDALTATRTGDAPNKSTK